MIPTVTSSSTTTATCVGQLIQPATSALSCDQLSRKYGITTGDLNVVTGDWDCGFTGPICVPANCTVDYIPFGQTCDTLRTQYSTASGINITASMFLNWNPNIIGLCDRVAGNQYVCKSAPGGTYIPPTSKIVALTATSAYYTTASASNPTSSGTTKSCGKYYNVVAGDNCNVVCLNNGISFTQLRALNTQPMLRPCRSQRTEPAGPAILSSPPVPVLILVPVAAPMATVALLQAIAGTETVTPGHAKMPPPPMEPAGQHTVTTTALQATAAVSQGIVAIQRLTVERGTAIMERVIRTKGA
ncbi:hypothetical protein BP5796_05687 [Coleophoma crateriformis]|uniref:LysM domain-containing protein n=1 Tax=Coleophoma crateriformis TaxID=565419 RepID=A0A3D8S3X3_9HELO|nr:hypothetical protein BP5796_05687 [Coleophoma crateriformis]